MKRNTLFITQGAMLAALYVVLTWLSSLFGLSSGVIQFRISEALAACAIFTPAAIPGLSVGCMISNILFGGLGIYDVIFGTIATLIGTFFTYKLRKYPYHALIPPILSNTIIVPYVLYYYLGDAVWFSHITVFIGEFVTCGILGAMLYLALKKTKIFKKR